MENLENDNIQELYSEVGSFTNLTKSQQTYSLEDLLELYNRNGKPIEVNFRKLVSDISFQERATHRIHPYPAKLLPHIPAYFLSSNALSKEGDTVLDPFSGSGTVLLEAQLFNRKAIGADSNPLARLISRVKTSSYKPSTLESNFKKLVNSYEVIEFNGKYPDVVNIDYWFHPHVKKQLSHIYQCINSTLRNPYKEFFTLCFSVTIKKVSLADPSVSVPVRLKYEKYKKGSKHYEQTKSKLENLKTISAYCEFEKVVRQNINRVEDFNRKAKTKQSVTLCTDARNLVSENRAIRARSVQLIITSPPYAGAQKYIRASSLNLGWTNLCSSKNLRDLEKKNIGREHYYKVEYMEFKSTGISEADKFFKEVYKRNPLRSHIASNYLSEMKSALEECYRVLKSNGFMVLVSSNNEICGENFPTHYYLSKIAEEIGFKIKLRLIDHIDSRGLMTKRNKTAGIIHSEWVYLLKKDETHNDESRYK